MPPHIWHVSQPPSSTWIIPATPHPPAVTHWLLPICRTVAPCHLGIDRCNPSANRCPLTGPHCGRCHLLWLSCRVADALVLAVLTADLAEPQSTISTSKSTARHLHMDRSDHTEP